MKILHIIVGLNVGGAESMLKRLIESDTAGIPNTEVVSLTSIGVTGESLRSRGVCVHSLGMSSALDFPITLWRLVRLIRQYRPTIVQTWMYHADFLGGLAARLAGSCAIVWGIRNTSIPQGPLSFTFWLVRLCAILSYVIPGRIICCAKSAKEAHARLGYSKRKMTVIPNGYDFSFFNNMRSRTKARDELGFDEGEIVVGAVGRFDPLKDYRNFIVAASGLSAKLSNVKFLMVGRNVEWSNHVLREWIEGAGLAKKITLVGEQAEISYFLSAMDVFCLSSSAEGFPNVLVEAMAMGLPCVVTRAGDAADILGVNDFVVPVKDSASLADALIRMCVLNSEERGRLGESGARKVRAEYGIDDIRRRYEGIYAETTSN